jgi:hypothetical protein
MRRVALAFLVLLVLVPPAAAVSIDDFEGGDLGNWRQTCGPWQIVSPGCASAHAVSSGGPIEGQYRLDNLGFLGGLGHYSFDLMFPGTGVENGSLYFGMRGDCCFLEVIFGPVAGDDPQDLLRRVRANEGTAKTLGCEPCRLPSNQWHHIDVESYRNGVIRVYADGVLAMEGQDTEFGAAGTIALYAHRAGVMFDNIAFDPSLPPDPAIPGPAVCGSMGIFSCESQICAGVASCQSHYLLDHPSDINCDGGTDILDVVLAINAAFRGAPASSTPPCNIAP